MKRRVSLLRQVEGRLEIFKRFVETSGQALGMADLEGRVFFANATLCRLLGEEDMEAVYQHDLFDFYPPETAARIREEILPLVREQGQWVGETYLIDKAGRPTPIIENVFLIKDDTGTPLCFATVMTDISERIRMEAELRTCRDQLEHRVSERTAQLEESNALLRAQIEKLQQTETLLTRLTAVMESTSHMVAMMTPDGQIVYINTAGRQMMGWKADEDINRHTLREVYPAWALRIIQDEGIPHAIAYGSWQGETALLNRDGREVPIAQVIMAHRDANGELEYLSTILRDISERKQAEEALRESEERFKSQYHGSPTPTFTWQKIGSDFVLVDFNTAADRATGGEVRKYLKKTASEIYAHQADILQDLQACFENRSVIRKERQSRHFMPGRHVITTFAFVPRDLVMVHVEDITERIQGEQERTRLMAILDSTSDLVGAATPDGQGLYLNEAGRRMAGFGVDEDLTKRNMAEVHPAWIWPSVEEAIQTAIRQGVWEGETVIVNHQNGKEIPVSQVIMAHRGASGELEYISTILRDISESKRVEEALRKSEERYRRIVDTVNEGIWTVDADSRTTFVDAHIAEIIGYPVEEIIGRSFEDFLFEDDLADHAQRMAAREQGLFERYERRFRHKDGHAVFVLVSASPIFDDERHFQGSFAMFTDITERVQAEEELQKLASVVMHCSELVNIATPDGKMIYLNDAAQRMLGISADEVAQTHITQVIPDHLMEKVQKEVLPAMMAGGWEGELEYKNLKSGALTSVYATIFLVKDSKTGVPLYHANVSLDITARKQVERNLKESLEILAEAERIGHTGSWKRDLATNAITWSAGTYRIMGFPEHAAISFEQFLSRVHPDDREALIAKLREIAEKGTPYLVEFRIILPDGTIRYIEGRGEVSLDPRGKPDHIHGTARDITERKHLEDELIKAQRLDSIGTLAGGIAHDYNNLLTAILGNMELAKMNIPKTDQAHTILTKAEEAAKIARDLTRRLITFSLGGYPIGEVMPLREILTESVGLALSGTHTKAVWEIAADLPAVKIDENQIRQVIHNIVINAHEAMPQGGRLTIVAERTSLESDDPSGLPAGIYVRLAFRDEGRGIPAENLPRIFDPYFTTKGMGSTKGLGLSLSICYSIIKRHGGHIMVESQEGVGTTVTIYIPAAIIQHGI